MKSRNYSLFGITLSSDFQFASRICGSEAAHRPQLSFGQGESFLDLSEKGEKIYPAEGLIYYLNLFEFKDHYIARISQAVDFSIYPDRIAYHLLDSERSYLVEICFLGEVMSLWLESRGVPALHASAVCQDGRAAAFLSTNRGGKSALAASMMKEGYSLLTDDILAVEGTDGFFGRPGYPQMKMWEDEAEYFLGGYEELDLVHPRYNKRRIPVGSDGFGSFCDCNQSIAALYLPDRQDSDCEIRIEEVSPRDAVIEIIRNSFSAGIVEAMGISQRRMEFFAQMARRVPMRRLIYPTGFQNLPKVNRAIRADLARAAVI
jgi:hypothetical protein